MSEREHGAPEMQSAFERTLLRSARADAPPPDSTEQAWLRFSGAMGAAALSAGTVHASTIATSGWARLLRLAPLKYLVIGALSGSALTAAWFQTHPLHAPQPAPAAPRTVNVDPSNARASVAAPITSESAGTRPLSAPLTSAPKRTRSSNSAHPGSQKSLAAPALEARTTELNAAGSSSTAASSAAPYSTLPAETAALDAARTASAAGKFPRALNLLQQFRQNFPNSVLRADAEVVTIQTLEAAGDHAQAARRAMQFLTEYPNDPHSAALKRLLR